MDNNLPQKVVDISLPIPSENVGKKILIFGFEGCPDCARIKQFLNQNAIEYEYHDIHTNKKDEEWLTSFSASVPVLIMLDQSVLYSPSNDDLLSKIKTTSVNEKVYEVSPQVFDTIIIGAGPAGLSAAIYAVRKSLKVLLISKDIGGQAARSGSIENYLGFTLISGIDLVSKFRDELDGFKGSGLWIKEGVEVTGIIGEDGNFSVTTKDSSYLGKTVILASGRIPRMLGIPGEKEFFGRGVATCATCDAPLFKGKEVVVVGGGNSALDAAFSLSKLCKKVTIVNITDSLKGDEILLKNVTTASNVEILNNSSLKEILGTDFVIGVKVDNIETHAENEIPAQGVFIEIGWIPATDFVPQLAKDKQNQVIVDEFGKTSLNGIWAAGDVNNLWGEQIIIAAGEGAKVALSVAEHVAKIPHQTTSNTHEQ